MPVSKSQRALVLINSLSKYSTGFNKFIYSFAEGSAVNITNTVLGDDYKFITIKSKSQATKANFLAALRAAVNATGIKAVDVFLQLHGGTNTFHFYEGAVPATRLRDDILALSLPNRLRLLYNTGCYGDSQNWDEMIAAGFKTTIGSRKINTTGATEFPTFCSMWQFNAKVRDILAVADNPVTRATQDAAAKAFSSHLSDANSQKIIRGNTNLTIST